MPRKREGWIGVDLDGTLAFHGVWLGPLHVGEPIPLMVQRVKAWLAAGYEVRIVTARVAGLDMFDHLRIAIINAIQDWTELHIGARLLVTSEKDYEMIELWDDRAIQVIHNTGVRADGMEEKLP